MLSDLAIRFCLGGIVVSFFVALSDVVKPKTFSGVFGAAPSVALASLWLSYDTYGAAYVSTEARSMMAGGAALLVYSAASMRALQCDRSASWLATLLLWSVWLIVAVALWLFVVRL